jgi:hypothetical protein
MAVATGHASRQRVSISFSNVAILFPPPSKPMSGTAMALAGLGLRHRVPVRSFRIPAKAIPAKAMTAVFVGPAGVGHDVLCTGNFFDEFAPMRNGAVVIQGISPTATESA